jgi:hypothetical protein
MKILSILFCSSLLFNFSTCVFTSPLPENVGQEVDWLEGVWELQKSSYDATHFVGQDKLLKIQHISAGEYKISRSVSKEWGHSEHASFHLTNIDTKDGRYLGISFDGMEDLSSNEFVADVVADNYLLGFIWLEGNSTLHINLAEMPPELEYVYGFTSDQLLDFFSHNVKSRGLYERVTFKRLF